MILAGIDPGLSGAIALLNAEGGCRVYDMPTLALTRGGKNKREVDAHHLAALLAGNNIGHAFLEQSWAMPTKGAHARGQGQGPSSAFASGKGYGIIIGALAALGIPYTLVPAATWKRALGVPAAKDGARARASQLLPASAGWWPLVKHDGRAEAAMLCLFGARQLAAVAA